MSKDGYGRAGNAALRARWERRQKAMARKHSARSGRKRKAEKTMTGMNEFAKEVHENAVEHGWWDKEVSFPEILALIHAEVSEALEEYRNGHAPAEVYFNCGLRGSPCVCDKCAEWSGSAEACSEDERLDQPEGIPAELADVILRVLDYCAYAGIDIDAAITQKHAFNKTRPYRHGGKKL